MLRTFRSKFDISELGRKVKRFDAGSFSTSYRKLFLLLLTACLVFYILPPLFRYLFMNKTEKKDALAQCMDDRLTPFFIQALEFDANIRHQPPLEGEKDFIPYVGNGYFGLHISHSSPLNIKSGRAMHLAIPLHPILSVAYSNGAGREATVVDYLNGIVHRYQCFSDYFVSYAYYAHRTHPAILMQKIKITNTRNTMEEANLVMPRVHFDNRHTQRTIQLESATASGMLNNFEVITGRVDLKAENPGDPSSNLYLIVSIVKPVISRKVQLKKRATLVIEYPMAIYYSKPLLGASDTKETEVRKDTENKAIQAMTKALLKLQQSQNPSASSGSPPAMSFQQEHMNVWSQLWATGFSISTSKAEKSLNGDRINATMYAVLSQVRSYSYEAEEYVSPSAPNKAEIAKALTYAEGCYDSYHTLQADNLWINMDSLESLNNLVSSWILTLEKQGCHNLIRAGASGVVQAMVLSFGSFRFSNQHLECNMHPKDLHRDFHFRRLNYGNKTHVNVTIHVTEDNKAVINVALDRSDRSYYACDGGCLDEPVLLTQNRRQFPVKLTEPLTAILYITEDKQHMEELNKALHVKEVVEAPAHENHIIALHKHGHNLGGLPTLFWVSVCAIIIVFHVFLCKLIIKEYCEPSDIKRYRYSKP